MVTAIQNQRRALRLTMRQKRLSLSPIQQSQAATALVNLLSRQPLFRRSKRIAVYLAGDGEPDLSLVIQAAWALGKQVYLPVLQPRRTYRLWFLRYQPDTILQLNYYDILEPRMAGAKPLSPACLDLVLTPLVAFDRFGARLGMGGGYYDRTFAFKRRCRSGKPYLVGVAHSCQEVDRLGTQSWDIPLHAIATDKGIVSCGKSSNRDFVV